MRSSAALLCLIALAGCSQITDRGAYSLYRTAILGTETVHIATFDSKEGGAFNQQNCHEVANLIQSKPGVTVRYWCEPGRAR